MEKGNMVIEKYATIDERDNNERAMPALTSSHDHLELVMKPP